MTILSAAAELLATGPQTLTALVDHVVQCGATRAKDPTVSVRTALLHRAVQLHDGRWANPVQLLEGRVLTTTGGDRERYDLAPLFAASSWSPLRLATGGLLIPTFEPWEDDELLEAAPVARAVRVLDGLAHIEPFAPSADSGAELQALIGPLRTRPWDRGPEAVVSALMPRLWSELDADPSLLTAQTSPLSECFPELGAALADAAVVEEVHYWQPSLNLPLDLAEVVRDEAEERGEPAELWLNRFVVLALRSIDEAYLAPVVKLRAL